MENISFDAATYASDLRLAGNAWRNAEGKADNFARPALAALVTDAMSPLVLAVTVYDEMKPQTAKGKLAEPKESEKAPGGVSVSSLRSAKGGEGARSALEAVLYIFENRALDGNAVAAFIRGDKGAHKLFPLKAHIAKCKTDAAKAKADAVKADAGEGDVPEREGDDAPAAPAIVADITALTARIVAMTGEELAVAGDALAALMDAARDAATRLAASEQLEAVNA